MNKQERLKEVIHLYLGCEIMTPNGIETLAIVGILGSDRQRVQTIKNGMSCTTQFTLSEIKPILRSLDDMTEEEIIQMEHEVYQFPEAVGLMPKQDYIRFFRSTDDDVRSPFFICTKFANWARKNGFDCDNLIPDGIAINAKELQK
jgi:hypothetical protein